MSKHRRMMLAQLMLGLLVLRAYVPAGFMPQAGNPLQLQICSTRSAPAAWMLLAQTAGHASHAQDCPFGHAPVTGPAGGVQVAAAAPMEVLLLPQGSASLPAGVRILLSHQARAPPALA